MKLIVFKTPLLETAWCYYASVCNYRQPLPRATDRGALSLTLLSVLSFPLMVVRAWRGHGTEAFAVASQEIGIETASFSGYAYLQWRAVPWRRA